LRNVLPDAGGATEGVWLVWLLCAGPGWFGRC